MCLNLDLRRIFQARTANNIATETLEYFPDLQGREEAAAMAFAYFPAGQAMHSLELAES